MDEGYSFAAIADKVKCSHSCVSKTLLREKETGTLKYRRRVVDHKFQVQGRIGP